MENIYKQDNAITFEKSESFSEEMPKDEIIKQIKKKYELENLPEDECECLYNFIQTNQEAKFDVFNSDEFVKIMEIVSVDFDIDREKLFHCLARNKFNGLMNIDFDSKKGLEDADLQIEANIIFDYYENSLKKDFGDKEFIIFMMTKEEKEPKFVITDNLAQQMRINNDSGQFISFSENQYNEEKLDRVFAETIKKWTLNVCEEINKEFPIITVDQKIIQWRISDKILKLIEDNYKPFPWYSASCNASDWVNLSEEQMEEFNDFWREKPLKLSKEQKEEYRKIFVKSYELTEKTKENNIGDLDDLYCRYNISKINEEIESQNGSFHNIKENYCAVVFEGLKTFNTMRHEFVHEDNYFGWDGATSEALPILEEILGIADAKEYFHLSDEELFTQIKEEV